MIFDRSVPGEPVAWLHTERSGAQFINRYGHHVSDKCIPVPLYTADQIFDCAEGQMYEVDVCPVTSRTERHVGYSIPGEPLTGYYRIIPATKPDPAVEAVEAILGEHDDCWQSVPDYAQRIVQAVDGARKGEG